MNPLRKLTKPKMFLLDEIFHFMQFVIFQSGLNYELKK